MILHLWISHLSSLWQGDILAAFWGPHSIERAMGELHLRHSQARMEGDILVLTIVPASLEGEDVCARLRDELIRAVTESGAKKIVIDFGHVRAASSVAFRPLLSVRRIMQQINGRMLLCNLGEPIAHMFHATRLLNANQPSAATFQELRSLPDAIAELNGQGH